MPLFRGSLAGEQVRFFCDDSGAEGQRGQQQQQPPQHQEPRNAHIIKSLKEAPTCEYEMHFVSSTLCQHRYEGRSTA